MAAGGERQGEELARLGFHTFSPESESLGSSCGAMVGGAGGGKTGPNVEGEASQSEHSAATAKPGTCLVSLDPASYLSPSGWWNALERENMWTSGNPTGKGQKSPHSAGRRGIGGGSSSH